MSWQEDKAKTDRYLPEIKEHIGRLLIGEPPIEEDQERNTDLIVLRLDAMRIACRVRNPDYLGNFGNEFTVRNSRPSGAKTELAKIFEGWGNYMFYGFWGRDGNIKLTKWHLLDLDVFRITVARFMRANQGRLPALLIENFDNSSTFAAFKFKSFPTEFIIGCGGTE